MSSSLLQTFASLDKNTKEALADLTSPRQLSLSALLIAEDKCGVHKLTAEHITACLEAAGVAVYRVSVARALANARGAIAASKNQEGETEYKLMIRGRREIEPFWGGGRISVVRIESNQPRSARLKLREILSQLSGVVRICDPYYGIRTLDSLDLVPRPCHVRFLTARTNETGRQLQGALIDFKRERPNIEIRLVPASAGIHDRYIVTSSELLILGHGLKDVGGKESFIIRLEATLAPDLIKETIFAFDKRWNSGTPI
jgi:hypothetical protein